MPKIIVPMVFYFFVTVFSTTANAADALLECQIENKSTVVKVEKSLFGGKKVYFNRSGDWVKRDAYKQNDEYIWVRSDFMYSPGNKGGCEQTECHYDFLIELIERKRGKRKIVYIYRIADEPCTALVYGNCENLKAGDRLEAISCKVSQPFK